MSFFRNAQVTRVLSCLADPTKTRTVVEFEDDVSELLPYLNAVLPRVRMSGPRQPSALRARRS